MSCNGHEAALMNMWKVDEFTSVFSAETLPKRSQSTKLLKNPAVHRIVWKSMENCVEGRNVTPDMAKTVAFPVLSYDSDKKDGTGAQ